MLQEISETEMPSIRFQGHVSFSRLSPVSHEATTLSKAALGSEVPALLNPFPPSSDFIGKRKSSIHLRMLREKWPGCTYRRAYLENSSKIL